MKFKLYLKEICVPPELLQPTELEADDAEEAIALGQTVYNDLLAKFIEDYNLFNLVIRAKKKSDPA